MPLLASRYVSQGDFLRPISQGHARRRLARAIRFAGFGLAVAENARGWRVAPATRNAAVAADRDPESQLLLVDIVRFSDPARRAGIASERVSKPDCLQGSSPIEALFITEGGTLSTVALSTRIQFGTPL